MVTSSAPDDAPQIRTVRAEVEGPDPSRVPAEDEQPSTARGLVHCYRPVLAPSGETPPAGAVGDPGEARHSKPLALPSGRDVVDLRRTVGTARRQKRAVRAEHDIADPRLMSDKREGRLGTIREDLPHDRGAVLHPGGQPGGVGAKVERTSAGGEGTNGGEDGEHLVPRSGVP